MLSHAANSAIDAHIRAFFRGHDVVMRQWVPGPAKARFPNLRVLEIGPGPRTTRWTHVTCGAREVNRHNLFEYLMTVGEPSSRYIEILTMVAFYGRHHDLGLGHIIPNGEALVSGSACHHVYLSLPYPFGPALELFPTPQGEGHILWVLPITPAERKHLLDKGRDALETRFETEKVEYWSPVRRSVL